MSLLEDTATRIRLNAARLIERPMNRMRRFRARLRNGNSLRVAWILSRTSDEWKWRGAK